MIAEWIQECDLMTASRRIVQRERHAPATAMSVITKQTLTSLHALLALSRNALLMLRYKRCLYTVHSLSRNTNPNIV